MNEPVETRKSRLRLWLGRITYGFLITVFLLLILTLVPSVLLDLIGHLFFGWFNYLRHVVPRVSFSVEIASGALMALLLGIYGLHRILGWWQGRNGDGRHKWKLGWTVNITAMVLLLFATSIAASGIVHQIGWILRMDQLTEDRNRAWATREMVHLKGVFYGLRLYAIDHSGQFPERLESTVPEYIETHEVLFSRHDPSEPPEKILYYNGYKESDPEHMIILAAPRPETSGKRAVVRLDGAAQVIKEAEFQQEISVQLEKRNAGTLHAD